MNSSLDRLPETNKKGVIKQLFIAMESYAIFFAIIKIRILFLSILVSCALCVSIEINGLNSRFLKTRLEAIRRLH